MIAIASPAAKRPLACNLAEGENMAEPQHVEAEKHKEEVEQDDEP